MVGQVLKINIDEDFPADLLVLATSEVRLSVGCF